jgi:shikimate kinase
MTANRQHEIRGGAVIFLVGFMGSGKTETGRALASLLDYDFLDLDAMIEERIGKSIRLIFTELGEQQFRRLETEAIRDLGGRKHSVVALGGGAYQSEENRTLLRAAGVTVWLDCPFDVCFQRIKDDPSRPLLRDELETRKLFDQRRAAYGAADLAFETDASLPEEVAAQVIAKLSA